MSNKRLRERVKNAPWRRPKPKPKGLWAMYEGKVMPAHEATLLELERRSEQLTRRLQRDPGR